MKTVRCGWKICLYQLRILSKSYKLYTVLICLFIFMKSFLKPLQEFLMETGEKVTPFLFTFFMNGQFCAALVFAGVLLFFIDAPFYDKEKLFVMIRTGRKKWVLGQTFYIIVISVGYMFCWVVMSLLILVPKVTFQNEWGRVWTTLALTDAANQLGFQFSFPSNIILNGKPLQVFLFTFMMGCLICIFYGFCMWFFNLYLGKIVSVSLIMASILLVTRVRYMPYWMMYFVPSGWADIGGISWNMEKGISIEKAMIILIVGSILLGGLACRKTSKIDIAKG